MKKLIVSVLMMGFSLATNAGIITYTDFASFDAATSGAVVIDDYDDVGSGFFGDLEVRDRGNYSLTNESEVTGFFSNSGVGGSGSIVLGFSDTRASLKFTLDESFGGFYFDLLNSGTTPQTYTFNAIGEQVSFDTSTGFVGFVLSSATNVFTITDVDSTGNGYLDNFGVAAPASESVPAPATLGLLSLGLLGLRLRRKA